MRIIVLMICLLGASLSFAGGNIAAGKQKSAVCAACHGPDGNSSVGMWPKLAGQHPNYLYEQLVDFKKGQNGGRMNPSMAGMVAALSKKDMKDLAAYFASQKRTIGQANKNLVPAGQKIYMGGSLENKVPACAACHGPRGLGNASAGFPVLSGQHPEYVLKQLQDYKNGLRSNGINNIMSVVAKHMTEAEMKAVANYVSGLH